MIAFRSVVIAVVFAPCLAAQAGEAIRASFGVTVAKDAVYAGGPSYSARFDAQGAVFTPLLGKGIHVDARLHFTFLDCTRGEQALAGPGSVTPSAIAQEVHYARGGLVERYEARACGIEQSFVFAQKPAGSGDLVVRGRLTTALPLAATTDEGLRFELPGLGGVTFGAVTGVDAHGQRVRGELHLCGDVLELSLPAAFVDNAAYPLVLDPLVGTAFPIGNDPAHDDVHPAIAYDATSSRYLVVWAVQIPVTLSVPAHTEIRGQMVVAGGGVQGSQLLLATTGHEDAEPAVVNINSTNRFLVAWPFQSTTAVTNGFGARSVSAATGAMSTEIVAVNGFFETFGVRCGLGGDSRTGLFAGQHALVAYRAYPSGLSPTNQIRAHRIQVPATGDPVVDPTITLSSSTNEIGDVAVSPNCGSALAGRWLVAFGQSVVANTTTRTRIIAQVVDAFGALCGSPVTIVNSGSTGDVRAPTVATRDGNEFVVAWHDAVASTVKLRRGVVSGACGSTSWTFDAIQSPIVQAGAAKSPAIVFAKEKYLLAWQQNVGGQRVYTKGLDPATCASCGREERVDATVVTDGQPALASRWDGGDFANDGAMVAWSTGGAIFARHWTPHGTPGITSLGGSCGIPGISDLASYHGEPVLGDSTFGVDLVSPTSPLLLLVVGFSAANTTCGACTLVPQADVLLPGASPTSIPIPCDPGLIGASLYTQWIQYRPSGCPLFPSVGLSNCLRFTITE
jgi:hypothetical protein